MNKKTELFSYKGGCGIYVNLCVLRHLKEELAWAIDKWLWVISSKMLSEAIDTDQ